MRYIVYLDRLFLLQTVQTMVLLLLTGTFLNGQILSGRKQYLRIVLGAGAEALFFCGIFLMPGLNGWFKTVILAAGSMFLPVIVFRLRNAERIWRAVLIYHGSAFLLGGIFYAALGVTGKVLAVHTVPAAISILMLALTILLIWNRENLKGEQKVINVELLEGNIRIVTSALIDSGNTLRDPVSSRPVSIVERNVLQGRIPLMQPEKFRLIPYHTLCGRGIMQVIQIDRLIIRRKEQEITVEKPLLGLYDGNVTTDGDYRMILHTEYMKRKGGSRQAAKERKI